MYQLNKQSRSYWAMFTFILLMLPAPSDGYAADEQTLRFTMLGNATYAGIYDHPVTLSNGRWQGKPFVEGGASHPTIGLVDDFYLKGDLNGDGSEETIVLLWESSGGSGVNTYIAIMTLQNSKVVNLGTALIGDRVNIQSGRVENGHVELNVIQQAEKDAACCPTEKVTRSWSLGGLLEKQSKSEGILSLSDITSHEWVLKQLKRGDVLPAGSEVTLMLNDSRLSGKSACNRYFANAKEGVAAGTLSISEIGSTRMACPGEAVNLEQHYFEALGSVTQYGFINGMLALIWEKDGELNTMLFRARTTQ